MPRLSRTMSLLLDLCRGHAARATACRVTCLPRGGGRPRTVDCRIAAVGPRGRVRLRSLAGVERLSVPIRRLRRLEMLPASAQQGSGDDASTSRGAA